MEKIQDMGAILGGALSFSAQPLLKKALSR
jgi:hypothetical protein